MIKNYALNALGCINFVYLCSIKEAAILVSYHMFE